MTPIEKQKAGMGPRVLHCERGFLSDI